MQQREQDYQNACLNTLKPIVGQKIKHLIRDDSGHFGFATDDGAQVWIMCDPEGNGPGFAEIIPANSGMPA